ncbi:MAG: hypothetical protein HUK24_03015 [Sphaerochaetaceae bacterium]|nr:hypothetical protein [Sphaerochaetaceae bacterium]
MQKLYQLIQRKQDIGRLINTLHREEFLAIGIMDTGTKDDLWNTLDWYRDNFNYCLHVITQGERLQDEDVQVRYPDVNFIVFQKAPSLAERINALADVCMTTYFFLTRSDVALMSFDWAPMEKRLKEDNHPAALCPHFFNRDREMIPSVRGPFVSNNTIEPLSFLPAGTCNSNLYPFLGIGIYDRALFQRLRGFDEDITGPYWQALDFGTRCWLYGYPIYTVDSMSVLFYSTLCF